MLERFGAAGLAQETLQQGRVPGERAGQNLESDLVAGFHVDRPKDRAHPPGSQRMKDAIAADPLVGNRARRAARPSEVDSSIATSPLGRPQNSGYLRILLIFLFASIAISQKPCRSNTRIQARLGCRLVSRESRRFGPINNDVNAGKQQRRRDTLLVERTISKATLLNLRHVYCTLRRDG